MRVAVTLPKSLQPTLVGATINRFSSQLSEVPLLIVAVVIDPTPIASRKTVGELVLTLTTGGVVSRILTETSPDVVNPLGSIADTLTS